MSPSLPSQVTPAGWCVWRTRRAPSPRSSATCRCRSSPASSWPWRGWRSPPPRPSAPLPAPLPRPPSPSPWPRRIAAWEGRQTWCSAPTLVGYSQRRGSPQVFVSSVKCAQSNFFSDRSTSRHGFRGVMQEVIPLAHRLLPTKGVRQIKGDQTPNLDLHRKWSSTST